MTRLERLDQMLDPHVMAMLDQLDIVSRKIFSGKIQGERRSRRRGQSVEFADFRPYVHGDDLRFVDWNIYGRLDRLFLKLFLEDEDLSLVIAVDRSGSMAYGSPSKFDYARRLAMALGYIGLVNHNRVTLCAFGGADGVTRSTAMRGRRRTSEMGRWLLGLEASGDAGFDDAMRTIALSRHGRGVLVVISDFLVPGGTERGLRYVCGRGFDVHAIQLLAPEELEPAAHGVTGDLRLVDIESGAETEVTATAAVVRAYRDSLDAHVAALREFCVRRGITHTLVPTTMKLDTLLIDYLRRRGLVA
jgi:uncharacterized protein (DUF58 family)